MKRVGNMDVAGRFWRMDSNKMQRTPNMLQNFRFCLLKFSEINLNQEE